MNGPAWRSRAPRRATPWSWLSRVATSPNAALPYMGCMEMELEGVPVRLHPPLASPASSPMRSIPRPITAPRSGSNSCGGGPSRHQALWPGSAGVAAHREGPCGRASSSIIATRLDDLGLGKMAGKEKAYVGRELRQRENLQAPDRWSLVGIECLEPDKQLRGGSILFAGERRDQGPRPRLHHLGHLVHRAEQISSRLASIRAG